MEDAPALVAADVRKALRERFEADAILGARALPVAWPPGGNRPVLTRQDLRDDEIARRQAALAEIDTREVKPCAGCGLCDQRKNTVFGVGSPAARIMFVGEGPGADEDATGIPFVGRAGELLTKMIEAGMGLKRDDVYICNVVKCRPPGNRAPAPDEIAQCKGYLLRQIDIIRPEVIIALGGPAAQTLLGTRDGITRIRGQWHEFYVSGTALAGEAIPLMPTFHPAYLLRSPQEKGKAWADLKLVMARLGLPLPGAGG